MHLFDRVVSLATELLHSHVNEMGECTVGFWTPVESKGQYIRLRREPLHVYVDLAVQLRHQTASQRCL